MKKIALSISFIITLAACTNNPKQNAGNDSIQTDSANIVHPDTTEIIDTLAGDTVVSAKKTVEGPKPKDQQVAKEVEVKKSNEKPVQKPNPPSGDDIEKGKLLISQSDCFACHKEQDKLIGPAYVEVAKKYKPTTSNINYLSGKVISGGSGVWGEVPMTPHPNISAKDSKKMVQYILSLNN